MLTKLLDSRELCKLSCHFPTGVQIDPNNKNNVTVTGIATTTKKQANKTISNNTNKSIHLIPQLIFA